MANFDVPTFSAAPFVAFLAYLPPGAVRSLAPGHAGTPAAAEED